LAKPAQSRCHSFGRLLRLLAVRRARAANSKTSFCALDHVAALPRLLSNDEAEALADCTACSSCLVSVLCMSSEWWRCVCGVLGTGSSRSPRRSECGSRPHAEISTRMPQGGAGCGARALLKLGLPILAAYWPPHACGHTLCCPVFVLTSTFRFLQSELSFNSQTHLTGPAVPPSTAAAPLPGKAWVANSP